MLQSRLPQIIVEIDIRLREAIEDGAEAIAQDAKQRVPVATGKLRDAIHAQPEHEGVYVIAGDDDVWYGHLIENGTARTAPRPFLLPALEENRDSITKRTSLLLRGL